MKRTTTCKVTYTYGTALSASVRRVVAILAVDGRRRVAGRGTVEGHKLRLTLRHLHRGRYRLTLLELERHNRRVVIGHTSLVVS